MPKVYALDKNSSTTTFYLTSMQWLKFRLDMSVFPIKRKNQTLVEYLLKNNPNSVDIQNDELMAALALWDRWQDDVEGCLRTASHAKRSIGLGNHDDDFICCSTLDQLDVVPFQVEPGVLIAS